MCKAYSSIHSEPGSNSSMFNNLINKLFNKKALKIKQKKNVNKQNTISKINSYITITINVPILWVNFRIIKSYNSDKTYQIIKYKI